MTKPRAIICDLDGTLCDDSHRKHFVDASEDPNFEEWHYGAEHPNLVKHGMKKGWHGKSTGELFKPDYDAYFAGMGDDKPNEWCADLIERFAMESHTNLGNQIIFVTGRPEKYRSQTVTWLGKNICGCDWKLFMRPDFKNWGTPPMSKSWDKSPDERPSHIVKREIFEREIQDKYEVLFVLEDNEDCCQMYRELRLTVLKVM